MRFGEVFILSASRAAAFSHSQDPQRTSGEPYSITSSASESSPGGHLDAKRSRRLKVDDELELAALSGYVQAKGTTSTVIARIVIGCRQDAGPE